MSNPSVPVTRWCEICQIEERCCCKKMKAWCDRCVKPAAVRNLISAAVGECPPALVERAIAIGRGRTRDPGAAWLRAVG